MEKFTTVPSFTDAQIKKQLEKQLRFLRIIYPWLTEDNYQDGAVELRPIKRDKDAKYIKSYNTWRLEEKDISSLKDFLNLLNGQGYCLYYSVFAFNYNNTNGKQKGKINNSNSLYTSVLVADFDNITDVEFKEEKKKLIDIGIETVDIFTGHGFQSIIPLKEKVWDKDILNKFTKLMLSKGFKVDTAIVDSARVMRMPYSFNCKSLDVKSKHFGEGILPTTDISWTDKRYNLVYVFKALNTLPSVIEQAEKFTAEEINSLKTEPITVEEKKVEINKIKEIKNIKIENLTTLYGEYLNISKLPEPVQKMLQGAQSGLRNKVMLFIIPFFRNSLGLNIQTIKSILNIWGSLCTPNLNKNFLEHEIDRIYKYGFKSKYGKYTEELRKAYGYLEFNKFTRQNKILIPNSLFEDFDVIRDGAAKIYLALKLAEQVNGIKEFTKQDIQIYANVTERTIERNIKDLVALGYICKRKSNRRIKEKYIFYINPYFSSIAGFTMLENSVVALSLTNLTDGEIKLYTYLCFMVGSNNKDCWASQKYLAKKIGKKDHSAVSKMTDSLVRKKYITKKTIEKDNITHCIYNLNY
ncbi:MULTISPECIES: helix-turn-helix domain-containing protein [unclassified Clostridioides]|uniref:helix-turn-helix domain-containing protein n=1 Tax=unclassified Clostridioides TaxID=2635829 RepID=UPI001D0FE059|nr:helix-turn-helix domain-containing protein [Clostridioides sp. ES-W-0018-02]MCC0705292.1 helix-turn-helix domain-containing protein [Clostridioides sp. ES-S-0049-02]MCC0713400.1 helix-turn-helix domain-containing protein [Clostridioides sp. ES-W-0017-02]